MLTVWFDHLFKILTITNISRGRKTDPICILKVTEKVASKQLFDNTNFLSSLAVHPGSIILVFVEGMCVQVLELILHCLKV